MVNDESLMDELFMELASQTRRNMLQRLDEKDYKLSKIATDLDLTIQEAHRNVSRLSRVGLVEKRADNSLALSSFGKFVVNQLTPYEFLLQNEDYFTKHTTGDLPKKFIKRLGALRNSTLVCGIGPVLERWKNLAKEATSSIKLITIHYPLDAAKIYATKPKEGVKMTYIFGYNTEVPKERDEMLKKISWTKMISSGLVKRKMLKTVQVSVTISDKESCVFFPDITGQPDMLSGFFSKDEDFSEWCNDYFDYQWERADFFDESKLHKN